MATLHYLDLGASAAAVLLFLFAARSFVVGSNHEPLGWSFGLAAGGILAWLLREQLGGFGNGMRLGLGIILLLPALRPSSIQRAPAWSSPYSVCSSPSPWPKPR